MGRVIASTNIDESKDVKELASKTEIIANDVVNQVNGNLEFDKNIFSQTVSVAFPATANTEYAISHSLGVIPAGYIVCKKSVAADIYDGSTAFDKKKIYLKCTVASATVTLIIKGS